MSKRVAKTARVRKGAVIQTQHDALTVEAVEAYLTEILAKRPKRGTNPQCRTFNVRVTLGLGDTQKLAFYCRKANMTPSKWLAMHAQVALFHLKLDDQDYEEIHAMCVEVIEHTEPGRAVILTPENAKLLKTFKGHNSFETADIAANTMINGWHQSAWAFIKNLEDKSLTESERKELFAKARAHFGQQTEGGRDAV